MPRPPSTGMHGAGDVGGVGGGQEGDDAGDLVGVAMRAERHGGGELGQALVAERGGHVGRDGPGRDDVDGDAARAELAGQRAGEADEAGLGGGVVGLAGRAEQADDRRHEDDAARRGPAHPWAARLATR